MDLEKPIFDKLASDFLEKLKERMNDIEKETRGQRDDVLWFDERKKRITASNFGAICRRRDKTPVRSTVIKLLYSKPLNTPPIVYGRRMEEEAVLKFEMETGLKVEKCDLFVDPEHPFLGASPDGLIGEDRVLEIKCPLKISTLTPEEGVKKLNFMKDGKLKKTSHYYYQVQGQLGITRRKLCYFVVYTKVEPFVYIEEIEADKSFFEEMKTKLTKFYMDAVLPELIDPRYIVSAPIREPYIS